MSFLVHVVLWALLSELKGLNARMK